MVAENKNTVIKPTATMNQENKTRSKKKKFVRNKNIRMRRKLRDECVCVRDGRRKYSDKDVINEWGIELLIIIMNQSNMFVGARQHTFTPQSGYTIIIQTNRWAHKHSIKIMFKLNSLIKKYSETHWIME